MESEHNSSNAHVINLDIQLADKALKQRILSKSKKKSDSSSTIWWVVGAIVILFLWFK